MRITQDTLNPNQFVGQVVQLIGSQTKERSDAPDDVFKVLSFTRIVPGFNDEPKLEVVKLKVPDAVKVEVGQTVSSVEGLTAWAYESRGNVFLSYQADSINKVAASKAA